MLGLARTLGHGGDVIIPTPRPADVHVFISSVSIMENPFCDHHHNQPADLHNNSDNFCDAWLQDEQPTR